MTSVGSTTADGTCHKTTAPRLIVTLQLKWFGKLVRCQVRKESNARRGVAERVSGYKSFNKQINHQQKITKALLMNILLE